MEFQGGFQAWVSPKETHLVLRAGGPGTATPAPAVAQQAVEDKSDGLRTIK